MGQSPSAPSSSSSANINDGHTPSRTRNSFALGQRRSPTEAEGSRRSSDSTAQRRSFGSFLSRRSTPSNNNLSDSDSLHDPSLDGSGPELPRPRQLDMQNNNWDELPSLNNMEEPPSSRYLTLDEMQNLSSSDLTVGQSNRDSSGTSSRPRLHRSQPSDRSLDDVPPLSRYDADNCSSPLAHSSDDISIQTPEASRMDNYASDEYTTASNFDASAPDTMFRYFRRASVGSLASGTSFSDEYSEVDQLRMLNAEFYPQADSQWMGRSIETLLLGYVSVAPILRIVELGGQDPHYFDDGYEEGEFSALRRRSTASTFGGLGRRRSSQGSFPGGRRGSLSLSGGQGHGGTLASYYRRRGQPATPNDFDRPGRRGSTTPHVRAFRRRSSMAAGGGTDDGTGAASATLGKKGGPNVCLSIMARENTGKSFFLRGTPVTDSLRKIGGHALYNRIDKPAAGIVNEVAFLAAAIDAGDWSEVQNILSRLAPRLIGDPMGGNNGATMDPNLPPTAPRFYASGGRIGLERDAFVLAGGVGVLTRVFHEKSLVGQEMAISYDARDISTEIVATRLAGCWTEALTVIRELVYAIPALVSCCHLDDGTFIPFLFTLLSHDSTFEAAAALIEEMLAILSQSPQQPASRESGDSAFQPAGRVALPTTFFLGNVPKLYKLWSGFSCRQLAHFCRILALLIFEPEDRQLLESPAVLKSLELLRLRRSRALRAGRDATVDLNQSILLGDEKLLTRLLQLLTVTNYAPSLHNIQSFHVMAQYPFIADTLVILGLGDIDSWSEIDRQDRLARRIQDEAEADKKPLICELGSVAAMLEDLGETLEEPSNQMGSIIHVISAAQRAGVIVGRDRGRTAANDLPSLDEDAGTVALGLGVSPIEADAIQGLASVEGILSGQVLVHRLYNPDEESAARHFITTPEDAANSLQFNGIILGNFQVEVLFVLCTLLGGRRKLDTQEIIRPIIPILEDMFDRLPFSQQSGHQSRSNETNAEGHGVHGPGCECTPESALCVQFLRLIHNFCDRDVENYTGRRLLLSPSEISAIFGPQSNQVASSERPGLLSKIIHAFMRESDESPYRFWLASCIESFLRGSSAEEQLFVARSGLMKHLIDEISAPKLHCAGSLQTSFDILGELSKGNPQVVKVMVNDLDEELFHKVFSMATENLIDSNVFLRSLMLTVESLAAEHNGAWTTRSESTAYLTHSWLDIAGAEYIANSNSSQPTECSSFPEWFAPPSISSLSRVGENFNLSRTGWVFKPPDDETASLLASNTIQRLAWFLEMNKAILLRDLMEVVSLNNINHENICCLNTAIVVAIFAHRRKQLRNLLHALRNSPADDDLVSRLAQMDIVDEPSDILKNFREVLWFWSEYYRHRGRDRLSLEFSSHVRFQEWNHVVSLMSADDGSPTSLVCGPIRLPRSPYQRTACGIIADDGLLRGV